MDRVAGAPDAAATIIERCAGLPLALAIVAGRAATQEGQPLGVLAEELTATSLDTLSAGDPCTDVRSVLSWSYRTLTPGAARLFRLLGLHPGPDVSAAAAASLAGLAPGRAARVLAELTRANLVVEHTTRRYMLHDLLRAYAAELVHTLDGQAQRAAASQRLLDHYLHAAHTAAMLLDPARDPIMLPPPVSGVTLEELRDDEQAVTWLSAERPVLLAALPWGAGNGFARHTCQLAWALVTFLERRGLWQEFLAAEQAGLTAAERLADPTARARAHRYVASAHAYLGQLEQARAHLTRTLRISCESGDETEQAQAHLHLARIDEIGGHHGDGLVHARKAWQLFQSLHHHRGSADALNYVAWLQALLGRYRAALASANQALILYERLEQLHGQGAARDSLGYIHHHLGEHAQAIADYQQALAIYRRLGDRYFEATVLDHLADTNQASGDHRAAALARRGALAILDELRHPDARRIRAKTAAGSRGGSAGTSCPGQPATQGVDPDSGLPEGHPPDLDVDPGIAG
jgi:tetratricopeptide (TPR) repeat protein